MGDFSDDDRERLQECHTLLSTILPIHDEKMKDHETRLRACEDTSRKVILFSGGIGIFGAGAISALLKKLGLN